MVRFTEGRVLSFHLASGASIDDCAAIISAVHEQRGYHEDDVYDWLIEWAPAGDGRTDQHLGPKEDTNYKHIWRSPDRTSFVVRKYDAVIQLQAGRRIVHKIPFVVTGV